MGLISVREVFKTKGIVFFVSQKIVLSSHDSHLAPEMGETHDELLEVDFSIAVIVKDVDDPPEIARYTGSTFFSKFFAFQTGRFWAAFLGPRGPLVLPLVDPPARTPVRNENLDRHICLMNQQETPQTNLMAQWDPLDIPLEPKAPPSTPMTLKQVFWPH